jgi:hypothetical protein
VQKSETIGNLSKALTAVQSKIKPAVKDSNNPFFKSKYADLNAVWDSARELLAENGLAVIQGNSVGLDNTVIVETILSHESGEWIQSELCLPLAKHDPQGVGSAVTYGRRYGLAAIVGIVADVDDDGNHASGHNGKDKPADKPTAPAKAPTAKDGLKQGIQVVCQALNASGDSIKWSKQSTTAYMSEMFGGIVSLDSATEEQLKTVADDLQARLKALKENK